MRSLTVLLVGLALAPAAASAAPAVNGEFSVSDTPGHLTQGPDGNVWVIVGGAKLAKLTPDGTVTEFASGLKNAVGITTGPDGNLWVTQTNGVAKVAPANPTAPTAFPIADITDPRGIATGPDGNLWAASGTKVIKIPPANPAGFQSFTVLGGARGITAGNDGQLWVADFGGKRIVSVTTAGAPTNYPTGGGPQEVAAGSGNQIGYTDPGDTPESVGRIKPGGTPQKSVPAGGGDPFGIVLGNDRAYWIARFAANDLLRLTSRGRLSTLTGFSAGAGPRNIARGAGDTLWVSLETAKKVARVSGVSAPSGTSPSPPPGSVPVDITAPTVSSLAFSASVFHRGTRLPRLSALRRPTGTTIRWRVDEQSRSTLTFRRLLPGRRVGRRCVAPRPALRNRPRCTRFVLQRPSLTYSTAPGLRKLRFFGRLSRRKYLAAGRYELTLVAVDAAGNRSGPKRKRFTLLPPLRTRRG